MEQKRQQENISHGDLRSYREAQGWTQATLANAAGLTLGTVSRVENGGTPKHETIEKLAAAFQAQPEVVYGWCRNSWLASRRLPRS